MDTKKTIEQISPEQSVVFSNKSERVSVTEAKAESLPQKQEEPVKKLETSVTPVKTSPTTLVLPPQDFQKQRAAAIDRILSEGLNEVFIGMDAKTQHEFKQKGEETVVKINLLLGQAKVKVNKIIDLIRAWLKIIPGINKFFLEQETKIKADKILKIKDKF